MATFSLVIVPAKKLSDGTHKIRIRVAHNSDTRFITTEIVVRENEFKNGKIVQRPDKDFLNIKLQEWYNTYFKRYIELEHAESLTLKNSSHRSMRMIEKKRINFINWPLNILFGSPVQAHSWNT